MAMVMGVASAAADEVTLTKTDGSASGLVWTSTTSPVTTITLSGGGFLDYDDGIGINVAGDTRTVTIASTSGCCHVTGYSMTVTGFSGDGVIITAGDQTLTTDATDQVFAVSGIAEGGQASFTIAPTEAGHAKKMIVKSLTVTYELNSTYDRLSKSGWSVSACSSAPSEGGSSNGTGAAANLIDDNAGTYWHSNWTVCNASSRHFFEINLGESKTFDACSFMQRQNANAWNGAFQDVSIFVGSSPFGLTHDNIASFLERNTPVATVTLLSNDKSEQYLYFDTPQTGQYVLVVPTLTVNPGNGDNANNKYACLAEFSLYEKSSSALTSANAMIEQKKAEVIAAVSMFAGKGLLGQDELDALSAAINGVAELTELTAISEVAEKLAEIEAVGESVYSTLSGRLVYVVNTRRQALGQAPYLTIMENGNVNTINYRSELGKWMLVRDGQTANFRLYSLEKDGYLVVVDNKGLVNANGQKFYFDANSYNNNVGLAMHYVDNGNDGFNIDTSGNPLTSYGYTDNGSSWVFELAGSMAEDLTDGGYYRIRSNRGMYNANGAFKTAGSLLGINTVVTDGATEGERQQIHVGKDGLGAIWQLKAVDGGFQAYNVAADFNGNDLPFALGARGDGSNKEPRQAYAVAADNAETMVVFNAKGSGIGSYNGRIPYSLAVKTPAVGNSCMDINGDGVPVLSEWNPGSDEYNNGSIYYFEALAEEELNAMKDAYVAAAARVDVSEFDNADVFYQGYEPLFGDDALSSYIQTVNGLKEALENEEPAVGTDVKSANAASTTNAGITDSYRIRKTEALVEIAAEANGRQVHFYNVQYPASMLAAGASTMAVATDATNVTTVWTLEQTEGMKYRLLNHGTGAYAGHYDRTDGSGGGSIPVPVVSTADEACEYELVLFGDGQVGLQAGTGSYPLLHRDGQERVVKWTSTSEASKWTASMVDTDPVVIDYQKVDFGCTAVEDVVNSIYFEAQAGSTLAISQGLGAHHTILVERFDPSAFPSQQAEAVMLAAEDDAAPVPTHTYTISKDDLTVNGNRLEYVPEDEAIEPGVLRMTAPMGFFTVDGKLSAPFTVHFTVASDGTTTGIDEVTEAAQAEAQWYTVQGVRVAAPSAAGIYVRVAGGKTTKVYVGL